MRNAMTRWLVGLGLVLASFAWFSMLYRTTWGDANTWPAVVEAALDDDEARGEIVAEISIRLAEVSGTDADETAAELERVLADRTGRAVLLDQLAATSSAAAGMSVALFDQLAGAASALPGFTVTAPVPPEGAVDDAVLSAPPAAERRGERFERYGRLATLGSIALLGAALVVGRWWVVLRRFGWWAIVNGGVWFAVPFLVNAGARRWVRSLDATIALGTAAYTSRIVASAGTLAVAGAACLVIGHVVPHRANRSTDTRSRRRAQARMPHPGAAQTPAAQPDMTGGERRAAAPTWTPRPTRPAAVPAETDTATVRQHAGPAGHDTTCRDADGHGDAPDAERDDVWKIARPGAELLEPGDVDVWAAYHPEVHDVGKLNGS